MLENARAKIVFVVPLDLGHFQKAFNETELPAITRVARRSFVLSDVSALEFARAIHGNQPAHHMAKHTQGPADNRGAHFAIASRGGAQLAKHFADDLTVTPFIFLDGANCFALIPAAD